VDVTVRVILLILSTLILVFAINLMHLRIKRIVRSKGYPVNLFSGHFRDIRLFKQIIESEDDSEPKREYKVLFWCFCASLVLVAVMLLLLLRQSDKHVHE